MRTPEQLRARRVRRTTKRHFAEHPPTPKAVDPLQNAVAYLATLACDDATKRQGGLPG